MHLFGNLYESEMREVQVDGSLGGMQLPGVLQLLLKFACWPFAWAFDNSSFIS